MPTLGNVLDFSKYEARNIRAHQLGAAPSSPVTGQLYYNTGDNTLYWWDGTAWISARGGAAATPPATASVLGTIMLAGDLAGTASSPQIAAGVITDVEVAAANKDGADTTQGMRSLGKFAGQALAGNTPLDQVKKPTAFVDMNGFPISNVANPGSASDAATKSYVDNVAQGLDAKQSVKCATTVNIGPPLQGLVTVDGYTLQTGDRILVKDQTDPKQNGIWVASSTPWSRAADGDTQDELISAHVFVEQGTTQADTGWVCLLDTPGLIGTSNIVWAQFSAAGQIVGGAGLTKTGNSLDVGAGAGMQVNTDTIQIASQGITPVMLADGAVVLGNPAVVGTLGVSKGGTGQTAAKAARETGLGATGIYSSTNPLAGTSFTILQTTHGLRASRGLVVQVQDETSGYVELPDVTVAANGDVLIVWGVSQTANSKRITIIG